MMRIFFIHRSQAGRIFFLRFSVRVFCRRSLSSPIWKWACSVCFWHDDLLVVVRLVEFQCFCKWRTNYRNFFASSWNSLIGFMCSIGLRGDQFAIRGWVMRVSLARASDFSLNLRFRGERFMGAREEFFLNGFCIINTSDSKLKQSRCQTRKRGDLPHGSYLEIRRSFSFRESFFISDSRRLAWERFLDFSEYTSRKGLEVLKNFAHFFSEQCSFQRLSRSVVIPV